MLLVCSPAIRVTGGVSEQAVCYLACGGVLERAPQPFTSTAGFVERTAPDTDTVTSLAGFGELATPTAAPFTVRGGFQAKVARQVQLYGGAIEQAAVAFTRRGALTECSAPAFQVRGGVTERVAVPRTTRAGMLQRGTPGLELWAGVLLAATPDAAVADNYSGWVLNTRKLGVGQYNNYPFDSLFKLGPTYFGISATGIEVLDGASDLGAPINAGVLSGVSNLGTDMRKVLTDAYLEVRCVGQMKLTIIYNEENSVSYELDPIAGRQGLYFKRIKLARGVDGTHIQVKVENVDGADFDLQTIRLITQPKSRRIYGS